MYIPQVRLLLGAASLLVASFSSQATLIVNGDFEMNPVNTNSWSWFSSSAVEGWSGSNIEIWNSMQNVHAASGKHFIELNAHGSNQGNWSIFQMFATDIGQRYELSFYYRARRNAQESFEVSVANLSNTLNDHHTRSWNFFSKSFVATETNTTLRFTSHNTGSYGNFIDNVSVVASVPEPGTLAVFSAGLFALFAGRRARRHKAAN